MHASLILEIKKQKKIIDYNKRHASSYVYIWKTSAEEDFFRSRLHG